MQAKIVALTSRLEICKIDGEGLGGSDVIGNRTGFDLHPDNTVLCPDPNPPTHFSCIIIAGQACVRLAQMLGQNNNLQFACDTTAPTNCIKACAGGSQADINTVAEKLQFTSPVGGRGAVEVRVVNNLGLWESDCP